MDWPAWIQAVGSIVALGAGAFFVWWQHHLEKREQRAERELQAGTLAVAIFPELSDMRADMDDIIKALSVHPDWFNLRDDAASKLIIDIGPALEGGLDRLYILGPKAGGATQRLVAQSMQINRIAEDARTALERGETFSPSVGDLRNGVLACRNLVDDVIGQIERHATG
jgi:hypothetical protein